MRREVTDALEAAWYDLASAEDMLRAARHNYVAFLAQQATKKMLKAAVMALRRRLYPKGHNLRELVAEAGLAPPQGMETALLRLSPHYVASRYLNAAGRYWEMYNGELAQELSQGLTIVAEADRYGKIVYAAPPVSGADPPEV